MNPEFQKFNSIPRLFRECVITEKIDGTNAQVYVSKDGLVLAGSRNRWITPEDDNFGFARWVKEHEGELRELGPGHHYGEWWGSGIQRGYGLPKGEKRFSLFNTARWGESRPACCHVVPVLDSFLVFETWRVEDTLHCLAKHGSQAAPGFMSPEGVVVWHEKARVLFKATLGGDGHKGAK